MSDQPVVPLPGDGAQFPNTEQPQVCLPADPTMSSKPETDEIMLTGREEDAGLSLLELQAAEAEDPAPTTNKDNAVQQLTPQEHIASIRIQQHLDDASTGQDDFVVRALDKSLQLSVQLQSSNQHLTLYRISRELYSEKTHFLWEIVQNADDNGYTFAEIPTLTFSAEPGHLLITSNETGFEAAHVEAICNVGGSTKKDHKEAAIGEKGIGFKSVFRVATNVWLMSNGYMFRFDRQGQLGMIAPIWDSFPLRRLDNKKTHFYLKLSDEKKDVDQKQLRDQLRELDGALLLFLRKLRRLDLAVDDGRHTLYGKTTRDIQRSDHHKFGGELARISTRRIQYRDVIDMVEYVVVRHPLQDMPIEEKRPDMSDSEVAIGFPFKGNRPILFAQNAFAFLPIRMTDFRFLIQGDFILTANREDIARDNDWNGRMLGGLVSCFLAAVGRFNSEEARSIRYTWIAFLRNMDSGASNVFAELGDQIYDLLKTNPVLETQCGHFMPPYGIYFVPEGFRGRDQKFILVEESPYAYMSPQYDEWDTTRKVTRRLGVQLMTVAHLLGVLRDAATTKAATFRNHPSDWHAQLASIIMKSLARSDVEDLPLIPLTHGRWAASNEGQVFFPPSVSTTSLTMPDCVASLLIVERNAAAEALRRDLFRLLKVKDLKVADVYASVLQLHTHPEPPKISLDELQSQLEFCFQYYGEMQNKGETIRRPSQFWVVNSLRNPCPAASVYHDYELSSGTIVSSILSGGKWASKMLLANFMQSHQSSEIEAARWSQFLESHLKLKAHIQITRDGANFTAEFKYVLERMPPEQVLEVLIISWLPLDESMKTTTLKQKLGALSVISASGQSVRLNQSFLPTRALAVTGVEGIPFLKVVQPDHEKSVSLEDLGVVIKPDLKFYIFRLEKILGSEVAKDQIHNIYSQIDAWWWQDPVLIRTFFEARPVIYFPNENTWRHKNDCVWAPTPTVVGEHALNKVYPDLYSLFFTKVWVRTASIGSVVDELLAMTPPNSDESKRRRQLLMALNSFLLKDAGDAGKLDVLRDRPAMPTKNGMLQPLNRLTWIFGERQKYRSCFENNKSITFADFSVQECIKLQPLAQAIRVHFGREQRLSRLVAETPEYGTETLLNIPLTNYVRQKLRYIRR